jgi:hypothetical protein
MRASRHAIWRESLGAKDWNRVCKEAGCILKSTPFEPACLTASEYCIRNFRLQRTPESSFNLHVLLFSRERTAGLGRDSGIEQSVCKYARLSAG